jgi:hypothetical protein
LDIWCQALTFVFISHPAIVRAIFDHRTVEEHAKWRPAFQGGDGVSGAVGRRETMGLQFGIFDHIEPVPGQTLTEIYRKPSGGKNVG